MMSTAVQVQVGAFFTGKRHGVCSGHTAAPATVLVHGVERTPSRIPQAVLLVLL